MKLLIVLSLLFSIETIKLIAKPAITIIVDSPSYMGGAGFFHNFHLVLASLHVSQKKSFVTVDFGYEGLYFDQAYGSNWWSYYFEPLVGFDHLKERSILIKRFSYHEKGPLANFVEFHLSRDKAYQLIQDHIRVKADILEEVQAFYKQHMEGYSIIGVHYRGTDKYSEVTPISYEDMIKNLQTVILNKGYRRYKIFVATDEEGFLKKMKQVFNGQVIAIEAARSSSQEAVHYAPSRKPYLIGKEALIDCLLLAKSDILVRTNSNLSTAAAFFNPHMEVINMNYPEPHLYEQIVKIGELNELNRKP